MILLNKAILSGWGFSFPCFLTAWHMFLSTLFTQILSRTTNMLTSVNEKKVTLAVFQGKILIIAVCFSVSIMLGNNAYLYLSVSYIQVKNLFIKRL
jgi:hypothetical protein